MKKLLFGLIATVMFGFVGNATESPMNEIGKKPWYLALLSIEVDIQFGQNKVINGVRYSCVDGGICRVRAGRTANWTRTDLSDVKDSSPILAVNEEDGGLYIIASVDNKRKEFLGSFVLESDTEFDEETLTIINNKLKEVNPRSTPFKGLTKGTVLKPFTEDGFNKIRLN